MPALSLNQTIVFSLSGGQCNAPIGAAQHSLEIQQPRSHLILSCSSSLLHSMFLQNKNAETAYITTFIVFLSNFTFLGIKKKKVF